MFCRQLVSFVFVRSSGMCS